jgi:hypothetical protein
MVCASLAACEAAKAPPRPVQTQPPSTPSADTPRSDAIAKGSSFQTYRSTRFDFSLPLPDGASFRIDDKTDRWFVATHSFTTSTLLVRAWREYEIMNRSSCEERARLHRTLPERERGVPIEERRIDVPPEHDTIVNARVLERAEAPRFEGTVLAFGGWAHRCFAFVFVTRDDDETTVAARLSTVVHGSLERMKFESDLVPKRIPPDVDSPLRLDTRTGPNF